MRKKKSNPKLVSIIFPNYNGKRDTIEYLRSLKKTTYKNFEIIVVDNASIDGSVEAIKKKFPRVKIIENKENVGITIAENQAIELSKAEYVVFTDNDMIVHEPQWLTGLVNTAESDPKIGSVVPVRISYRNRDEIETKGGIRETIENYNKFKFTKFLYKVFGAPIFITGVSLIKRKVIDEVGPFDEKMFGEFGDVDMHYRIVKAGYKVVYEPKSNILHKGSSTWKEKSHSRLSRHYIERLRFILKNYSPIMKIFTLSINLIFFIFLFLYHALRGRFDLSKAVIDGIVWNIKNWRDYI